MRLQGSRVAARTAEAGPPGRREPRAMTQTTGSCTHSTIGRRAGQGRLRLPDRRARPRRLDVRGPCPSPRGVQSAWLQVLGRRGPECPRPLDRPLTGPAAVPSAGHMSAYGEEAAPTEQPSSAPSSDVRPCRLDHRQRRGSARQTSRGTLPAPHRSWRTARRCRLPEGVTVETSALPAPTPRSPAHAPAFLRGGPGHRHLRGTSTKTSPWGLGRGTAGPADSARSAPALPLSLSGPPDA